MPEILKLDPNLYSLRHLRVATGYAPALNNTSTWTVLGKAVTFEELPISLLIDSPDLVNGTWTARLGDAGTWQIQVPNKAASDGVPWLSRFNNAGRNDWVEIRRAGNLEFVGCVESITADYQKITVGGHDAFWCLKSTYERDWQCLQAPRDVMYHASEVPVVVLADALQEASLNTSVWTDDSLGGGSVTFTAGVGAKFFLSGLSAIADIRGNNAFSSANTKWVASVQLSSIAGLTTGSTFSLTAGQGAVSINGPASSPTAYTSGNIPGTGLTRLAPFSSGVSLVLECDGRWIRGFVNGQFVGYVPASGSSVSPDLTFSNTGANASVLVTNFVLEQWQPFLMVGTDQGDYVLPGSSSTYPTGGLHARYYNDVASTGLSGATYLATTLTPAKDDPASGQPAPYDVIESTLAFDYPGQHVTSGFATTNWSVKYFGAIWLPLALGNLNLQFNMPASTGAAIRVWVGRTLPGTQLLDQWTLAGSGAYAFTIVASVLANGAGVVESGWYPIIVEFATSTQTTGPEMYFEGPLPYTWTDPGGTMFSSSGATVLVPSTSLSPLGCVDQRYQGISYFDMYQQTGNAFAYQWVCEPQQLESTLFPAVMAPRVREGHDTDEVLEADLSDAVSPVINYSNVSDATDQWSSVNAIGAGINDGRGSQLQAQVYALGNLAENLFDLQGWIDASDVSYLQLLIQRAASQLTLQENPWQNLTGDPRGMDRLADTFPVTGTLSEFHFRPGDGVRFWLPDIGVEDATPRQITQVTRTFGPVGRLSSTMTPQNVPGNLAGTPGTSAYALANAGKLRKRHA